MAIFVEMPDYTRAAALLDEAYRAHTPGHTDDEATHSYFALAGQTVNSVRTHLERYRTFGVNVSDASELPAEANGDIEQLRRLLEKVVEQAKSLHEEQSKGGDSSKGLDAAALLEDAATVRMRIARHDEDRARWQTEVSDARQHLFSSEMRIASISDIPTKRLAPTQPPTTSAPPPADKTAQPKPEQKSSAAEQQKSSKKSAKPSAEQKQKTTTSSSVAQPTTATAQPPAAAQKPSGAGRGERNSSSTDGAAKKSSGTDGAAKKSDGSPVAVGSLVARAKSRVSPSYPAIARSARVSGVVTVFIVVNEKGEVESVERAEGPMQLQQAATDAARRWKFTPTVIDGQPVRVTGYLSFNFSL
jgi:protein TonB